jgi:hypothetical protein
MNKGDEAAAPGEIPAPQSGEVTVKHTPCT